jgi:hypothetical protein
MGLSHVICKTRTHACSCSQSLGEALPEAISIGPSIDHIMNTDSTLSTYAEVVLDSFLFFAIIAVDLFASSQ